MAKHNILLVRHGESIMNTGKNQELRLPDHAVYLTERGIEQANKAGEFIRDWLNKQSISIDSVGMWVSPERRTRQTASEIVNKIGLTSRVKEDDMLVEMQFGLFDSIPKNKCAELFPLEWERYTRDMEYKGKFYARRPNGESPLDVTIRQKLFIETMFRDFKSPKCEAHNLIIVGHGTQITCFRKAFFHYSYEWYAEEKNPQNCSIQHIIIDDGCNTDAGYIYGTTDEN